MLNAINTSTPLTLPLRYLLSTRIFKQNCEVPMQSEESKFYLALILLSIFLSVCTTTNAQAPTYQWAKAIGGPGYDVGNAIVVDPESGDVYATGVFSGTVDFDPGEEIFNLTSAGDNDIFILKTNASGHFIWALRIGGTLDDIGFSIAMDASGDIYLTGQFSRSVDFDPGEGVFNLTSVGSVDIFISKLDADGHFIWAKAIGGKGYDVGKSIAVDPSGSGDVYIKGEFSGLVDFNPGTDTFYLKTTDYKGVFILKLTASGNFVWTKRMEFEGYSGFGQSIIIDATGNVYTTGWFHGTIDFDPSAGIYNLSATGINDIFISKLDADGNFIWAKQMAGTRQGVGISIGVDATGNVYTTGTFYGTIDFDPGMGEYNLTSHSNVLGDVFISKLDDTGNFVWAKAIGGTSGDSGNSIVVDPGNGDIYILGNFSETADFDPEKGIFSLTSTGDLDIFILKLNNSGHFVWAKQIGGLNADYGYSLALNASGNVHVAGGFRSSYISLDPTTLSNNGDYDIFFAKLNVTLPVSLKDIKKLQIEIFPNPTKDEVKIKFDEVGVNNATITLFDLSADVVFSRADNTISHELTLDISWLPAGIYIVEVRWEGNKIVKQIVKEQE